MKLSKAKKLFKAGKIQIRSNVNDYETYVAVTEWDNDYNGEFINHTWKHSNSGKTRQQKAFEGIKIVNLSDIKPGKKKTLKKRVKALEDSTEEMLMSIADILSSPDFVEVKTLYSKQDFIDILRATTEPKQ